MDEKIRRSRKDREYEGSKMGYIEMIMNFDLIKKY